MSTHKPFRYSTRLNKPYCCRALQHERETQKEKEEEAMKEKQIWQIIF